MTPIRRWCTRPVPGHRYHAGRHVAGAVGRRSPKAGCSVGDVSTANMVLENAGFDIPKVFGPASPEAAQLAADTELVPRTTKPPTTSASPCTVPRRCILRERDGITRR